MVVGAKIQKLSFGSGALVLSFSRRRPPLCVFFFQKRGGGRGSGRRKSLGLVLEAEGFL
jgi:hypothetical protein